MAKLPVGVRALSNGLAYKPTNHRQNPRSSQQIPGIFFVVKYAFLATPVIL
jgi:hypothetical protein